MTGSCDAVSGACASHFADPCEVAAIDAAYLARILAGAAGTAAAPAILDVSRELLRAGTASSLAGDVYLFRIRHRRTGGGAAEQTLVLKTGRHPAVWRDGVAARCRCLGLVALAAQVERHRDAFSAGVPLEILAYREIVPRLPVAAPRVLHTVSDQETGRYWVFMEEVAGTVRGSGAGGEIPWSELVLEAAVDELARLHAVFFRGSGRTLPAGLPLERWSSAWIESTLPYWIEVERAMRPRCRDLLGAPGAALIQRASANLPQIARRLDRGPRTIVHGDCSPGNLVLAGGRLLFTDWGNVACDTPAFDLHCLIHAALDPSVEPVLVTRLVERYLLALAGAGCAPPERGEFLELYDLSVLRYTVTRLLAVCCLADPARDPRPFRILERNVRWALEREKR